MNKLDHHVLGPWPLEASDQDRNWWNIVSRRPHILIFILVLRRRSQHLSPALHMRGDAIWFEKLIWLKYFTRSLVMRSQVRTCDFSDYLPVLYTCTQHSMHLLIWPKNQKNVFFSEMPRGFICCSIEKWDDICWVKDLIQIGFIFIVSLLVTNCEHNASICWNVMYYTVTWFENYLE